MKGLLLTAFSLLVFGASYAQDDDNEGPTRERSALDGTPIANQYSRRNMDRPWCSKNTIALAPFQYSENGVGVGLSYEHALDPDGIISLYVPMLATFNLKDNDYRDPYYTGYYGPQETNNNVMFYAMPGIKFYPTGMGKVKYAVGPSVVAGFGQKTQYINNYVYDPINSYYVPAYGYGTYDRFLLGMMINNSLNINATPRLYVGAEMGFGFTYFDRVGDVNQGVTFLTQGAFKIGYTF
jgi:hypothetical protein